MEPTTSAAEQERAYQKKLFTFQKSLTDRPLNMEGFEAVPRAVTESRSFGNAFSGIFSIFS